MNSSYDTNNYDNDYDNDYNLTEGQYQEFKEYMITKYDIYISRKIHEISNNVIIDCWNGFR